MRQTNKINLTKQQDIVNILCKKKHIEKETATAFAPTNIALCKYWGKRNFKLNLPESSSLSVSLDKNTGTFTSISIAKKDSVTLNGKKIPENSCILKRTQRFLDLFRNNKSLCFSIKTKNTFPISAGLASSASGFAALTQALNILFNWDLSKKSLSILARLGSGSASRSLWQGFAKWNRGKRPDGMDSFAEKIPCKWPDLRIGVLTISKDIKKWPSRDAMNLTKKTATYYKKWQIKARTDFQNLEKAILEKNFELLGKTAEQNALAMHAATLTAWPPILYWQPETVEIIKQIWSLREDGLKVYFTQDAGPNIKIIFTKKSIENIKKNFPEIKIYSPF